jgi:hypothetical protein
LTYITVAEQGSAAAAANAAWLLRRRAGYSGADADKLAAKYFQRCGGGAGWLVGWLAGWLVGWLAGWRGVAAGLRGSGRDGGRAWGLHTELRWVLGLCWWTRGAWIGR